MSSRNRMDKNTILAIVLSTIILVAFMFLQQKYFSKPVVSNNKTEKVPLENEAKTVGNIKNAADTEDSTGLDSVNTQISDIQDETDLKEEKYFINNGLIKATFTNKGGDIVGYELLKHQDNKTGKGVEMADNISATNRLCAISFGDTNNKIINKIFKVQKVSDDEIRFFHDFSINNSDGSKSEFTLIKQYIFKPSDYMFELNVIIDGKDNFNGLNFNNVAYTIRTSPQIGPHFDKKVDRYENRQFIAYNGEKSKKITLGTKQFKTYDKAFKWVGIAGKYFEELVVPQNAEAFGNPYYSTQIEVNDYANAQALLLRNPITASKNEDIYHIYIGPRHEKTLRMYNGADMNPWKMQNLKLTESLQNSGFLSIIETVLKWMMELIYKLIPNWGVSIIILTAILKFALFPLTKKTSLGTLKMQELQPQLAEIQERYKDDQKKVQEETAKIYQKSGYNPASGCLPMILQFVILFAMYNLFNNYFEFRGASFIPGWIPDLSAGDSVMVFKFYIPFLGNHLRILPIIYVASQLFFGKITNNGGTTAGPNNGSMKFMMYGMPLVFFFLFYNAPSGLLLYWTVSNLIQMGQQLIINKIMAEKKAEMAQTSKPARVYPPKKR